MECISLYESRKEWLARNERNDARQRKVDRFLAVMTVLVFFAVLILTAIHNHVVEPLAGGNPCQGITGQTVRDVLL
jgi:hypothetical protein